MPFLFHLYPQGTSQGQWLLRASSPSTWMGPEYPASSWGMLRGWVTILSAPLSSGLAQHRSQQTTLTEPESPLLLCSPPLPQVCRSPEVLHSVVEGTTQPSQSNPLNSPQPHPTGQALDGD